VKNCTVAFASIDFLIFNFEFGFGSTNPRTASAITSSEPLPTRIFSGAQPWSCASFSRNAWAVGFGYSRSRPSTAFFTARKTCGDGGYGFSFVLSLINPLIFGCSPGTYACNARTRWRINGDFDIALFQRKIREKSSRASRRGGDWRRLDAPSAQKYCVPKRRFHGFISA